MELIQIWSFLNLYKYDDYLYSFDVDDQVAEAQLGGDVKVTN